MGIQLKLPAKHEVVNRMSESDTKELEMINAVKKNDKAIELLRLTCQLAVHSNTISKVCNSDWPQGKAFKALTKLVERAIKKDDTPNTTLKD